MKVTLYKYTGDSDVANKILRKCTVVYNKEVVPYGAFDPNGATFRLDTLHDVNYGKFTFNGHDYYGYVDVDTDSKGLYNYSITTDPLTTAWYADCFKGSTNICKYSDYGTGKFFDDRATYVPDLNYEYIQVKLPSTSFRVILVISRAWINGESNSIIYNPLYDVYSMSFTDYARFSHASGNNAYSDARNCIFRFFAVPVDEVTSLSTRYEKVTQVELYQPNNVQSPSILCPGADATYPKLENTYKLSNPASGYSYNENWLSTFTATISNKPINSWRRHNMIKLYVEDMGYIAFKYSDVAKGENITSIGYRKSFDFVSGLQRATLIVNGNLLKDYFIQTNIANTVPYFDTEHQKSYSQQMAGMLASGVGLVSGIMTLGGSGFATTLSSYANASGRLKELKKIDNILAKANIKSFGLDRVMGTLGEQKSEMKKRVFDTFKNAGGQLGAQNIVSSINSMVSNSQGEGYAVNGSGTGSLDLPSRQGSFIIWQEAPPHNLTDIESKFGKPDGLARNVGNLTGWVQTEACHLQSNGLPFDIVTQAERISDNGFRIVT